MTNEGFTLPEAARAVGIPEETMYLWKEQYGALEYARSLRALEEENARLRRIVAKQALDIAMLKHGQPETFRDN